jgi:UDP:flavonoid glycosyltransferase YjiC (YdhE family)
LRAWSSLLRAWSPAALVADYAPTALLAARAAGLPRVTLGTGFSAPPVGDPMPGLRPWVSIDTAQLARRDARLVSTVAAALDRALPRAPAPRRAADLFEADTHLVCAWPRFDPFGPRDGVEYLGIQDLTDAREIHWISGRRPRIFAYLKPRDPRFAAVIAAIARVAGEAIVAAPGLDGREAAAASSAQVRVLAEPVALGPVLREADLCVSHSGPGTTSAAAARGVPQALLPAQLEQFLVARRLTEAGAARMLDPDEAAVDFEHWLAGAMNEAARQAAGALVAEASRPALDAADRIARLLGS